LAAHNAAAKAATGCTATLDPPAACPEAPPAPTDTNNVPGNSAVGTNIRTTPPLPPPPPPPRAVLAAAENPAPPPPPPPTAKISNINAPAGTL
jgi:hypothetical protein